MLNLMRSANRYRWFVSTIILAVVAAFVIAIFLDWGGAGTVGAGAGGTGWIARVNGEEITIREVEQRRLQIEGQYKQFLGDQFESQAASFDFPRQALNQMVGQTLAASEASRLGLEATDAEVADTIVNAQVFQRDGRFIGAQEYRNELKSRGYDIEEYEHQIAREISGSKLRDLMGTMVSVSESELDEAFRRDGETAEVDYVTLNLAEYAGEEPSESARRKHYEEHRSQYLTPELRRASIVLIDRDAILEAVDLPDSEVEAYYEENKQTRFTGPEQWRASHILFKTPAGASEAAIDAVRIKAETVLADVRTGGNFAELARQHSEDASAAEGGDLGWFAAGQMVGEFENAVRSLTDGEVSDLIKSQFGYHIIQRTGHRPAGTRTLDEVRTEINRQLGFRKGQELTKEKADEFAAKLDQQVSSFPVTAAELGYEVIDTGPVDSDDPLGPLGLMPTVSREIFRLQPGEHSGAINVPRGIAFVQVEETLDPVPAEFEAVADRVKKDLVDARAREKARSAAAALVKAGPEKLKEVAEEKGVPLQSTGTFTRSSAPPAFNDAILDQIFSHGSDDLIGPHDSDDAIVVVKIIKHGPTTEEEAAKIRSDLRRELLRSKQDAAFGALMSKAESSASIEIHQEILDSWRQAVGARR